MADLSRTEVEQIALLARLHLEPAEIEAMGAELGAILAHFATLAAVDTTDVPAMTHATETQTLRADVVEPSLPVEDALSGLPAKARSGDLIVVPSIIPGHES
ncbi:MAG: Asp-tRNA(Asn)/Glu-tRNA(Gln) amidotransferase subunit GatC [Deltaproteobacteria bacterium]|nr:Asp-tRNA(Asn)/Glu-tRNA(Gln) amidotransferase subunit GatC [Deltaproteobacteria bacterium]MCW5806582.1 Asp-tRNA(Asn)/Glu-tRNA(Gln) amidotransferase subunit GatC [Deltaproteobacteria bacterium]